MDDDLVERESEACDSAMKDATKLLMGMDSLQNISKYEEDYLKKTVAVENQLSTMAQARVEEAMEALQLLGESVSKVDEVKQLLANIDNTTEENRSLIKNLKTILRAHSIMENLRQSINWSVKMLAIPQEISEIMEDIGDETKLLEAHERIATLEDFAEEVLLKVESSKEKEEVLDIFSMYLAQIDLCADKFDSVLWSIMDEIFVLGQREPQIIVKVMRIVVFEDEKYSAKDEKNKSLLLPIRKRKAAVDGHRGELFRNLERTVLTRFSDTFNGYEQSIEGKLGALSALVGDLHIVREDIEPCFPPKFEVLKWFVGLYNLQIYEAVEEMRQEEISNANILEILRFLDWYSAELDEIGIEKESLISLEATLEKLQKMITESVAAMMYSWTDNILQQQFNVESKDLMEDSEEDGICVVHTRGPMLLFKMLNQQLSLARDSNHVLFARKLFETCLDVTAYYIQNFRRGLISRGDTFPVDVVCGFVNDTIDYHEVTKPSISHASQLRDVSSSIFGRQSGEMEDNTTTTDGDEREIMEAKFESVEGNFLELRDAGLDILIHNAVLADDSNTLSKLFDEQWYEGNSMKMYLENVDMTLSSLKGIVVVNYFRKLCLSALDDILVKYMSQLLIVKKPELKDVGSAVVQIQQDAEMLNECFSQYSRRQIVEQRVNSLHSVARILTSVSPDDVISSYSRVVDSLPEARPVIVDAVLRLRTSAFDKKQRVDIIAQCNDVYDSIQSPSGIQQKSPLSEIVEKLRHSEKSTPAPSAQTRLKNMLRGGKGKTKEKSEPEFESSRVDETGVGHGNDDRRDSVEVMDLATLLREAAIPK